MKRTFLPFLLLLSLLSLGLAHDSPKAASENLVAPDPPVLELVSSSQTIYHIVPEQSEARYQTKEKLIGFIAGSTIVGSTKGVEGQILIDWENPQNSQVGAITVNVEQLTSNSKQRDNRIRKAYLESTHFPEASFIPDYKEDFPEVLNLGDQLTFTLHGYLTAHDVTALTDWTIQLTVEENVIRGIATTTTNMSTFGIGPINIIGLLSTEDALVLEFDFVAMRDNADVEVFVADTTDNVKTDEVDTDKTEPINSDLDFFTDIKPIMETKCVGCHTKGEIGHSVYAMDTAQDVIEVADDLALMVRVGYMPPWLPSDQAPAFKHDRSLSDEQKQKIIDWAIAGALADGTLDTMLESTAEQRSIREDIVIDMPVTYEPSGELLDDYRCFLVDPNLSEGGFVTGSMIKPGDRRVVHHVIVHQITADAREEAEQKAHDDELPGWQCFGGLGLSNEEGFGATLGSWVPGEGPLVFEEGVAIEVQLGNLIVLEMHYNYEAGFFSDKTSIALQMADPSEELITLYEFGLFGAVEIPCPAGIDSEACNRDYALNNFHFEEDRDFSNELLSICKKKVKDFINQPADNVVSTCDWRSAIDGEVVMVAGHMHELGKSLRVEINPDSDNPIILDDLVNWDFNWQGSYLLETPIPIKKGDLLRLTCTWDNTRGITKGTREARYVAWGEGTKQEMCLHSYLVKPSPEYQGVYIDFVDTLDIPKWLKWFYRE